jgi:hypothetical protein
MTELKEEVKNLDELLNQATEQGYVTLDDILTAFPEVEENVAQPKPSRRKPRKRRRQRSFGNRLWVRETA